MQKCPKCGGNIRIGQRRCSHCGYRLESTSNEKMTRTSKENKKTVNSKARKIIPWGIAAFIIILLVIIFILLKNFNSPEAQSEILINTVDNNDNQKLEKLLIKKYNIIKKKKK